ncbi:subtilisin-like serine protease [Ceratobasidium sp. 394]|nr:subtilisin-like serine protease [Ceratobasidium sp. 394]
MHFSTALGAFVLAVPILGAPALVPIIKRSGPVKPSSYLVTFKDVASKDAFMKTGPKFTQSGSSVVYDYSLIPAAAMTLGQDDMNLVRGWPGIKSIEQDGIMSINYEVGLDGLDMAGYQRNSGPATQVMERDGPAGGAGVTVYGIDTGIYTAHNSFGGRAIWGATFGGYADADGNGHGTHTAGTAVGQKYSPAGATAANIIAVKVLSDAGSGSTSDVVMGVDFAFKRFKETGSPSIATMSLGGFVSDALDDAVGAAIEGGLHFTVAAGNSNVDANTSSPARVKEANTIGAVDSTNTKASFSNYGPVLDVWAPGVNITSAWIGNPNAENTISGTSMATPAVAGYLAVALGEYGQKEPSVLSDMLKKSAADKVKFGPTDTLAQLSSNHLLVQHLNNDS